MKKLTLLNQLFIMQILFNSCSSLKYIDAYNGYKNKPEKVEVTVYKVDYIDSLPKEEIAFKDIYFFDPKGRKIKSNNFKSDGSPSSGGWKYSYDKYGNEIQNILFNKDSSINVQNNYKYNKFGQLIERIYISDGKKSVTRYSIDRKNKLTKIIRTEEDGSISENTLIKHDKKWRDTELISYDDLGNQRSRIESIYDKNGNMILSKWYRSNNTLNEIYKTTYNFHNDRIQIEKFSIKDQEKKLIDDTKMEYKYDQYGNCIEEKLISDGKVSWLTRHKIKYIR